MSGMWKRQHLLDKWRICYPAASQALMAIILAGCGERRSSLNTLPMATMQLLYPAGQLKSTSKALRAGLGYVVHGSRTCHEKIAKIRPEAISHIHGIKLRPDRHFAT